MFKKLFLTLGLVLFTIVPANAGTLRFSHPSAFLECDNHDTISNIFTTAFTLIPNAMDISFIGCKAIRGFGSPVLKSVAERLIKITVTQKDWEDDPFAIFSDPDRNLYVIVYNPDDLEGQVAS